MRRHLQAPPELVEQAAAEPGDARHLRTDFADVVDPVGHAPQSALAELLERCGGELRHPLELADQRVRLGVLVGQAANDGMKLEVPLRKLDLGCSASGHRSLPAAAQLAEAGQAGFLASRLKPIYFDNAQARPLEHGKGRAAFGLRIALDKTAGPEGSYLAALGLSRRRSSRLAARA